jgi:hypothetical protein
MRTKMKRFVFFLASKRFVLGKFRLGGEVWLTRKAGYVGDPFDALRSLRAGSSLRLGFLNYKAEFRSG